MKKIVVVEIGPMPRPIEAGRAGAFDPMPTVTVTFDDNEVKELFTFYPDEISFFESELVGLTEVEAHALRDSKHIAFLKS